MKFKSSKRFIISFIFILVILFVSAYSTWSTGWLVVNNGVSVDVLVTAAETCHRVTNSGSYTYFVPTKTTTEWDAFAAHLPSGVGVGGCCECSSGDDCCSDGCNYDAVNTKCAICKKCDAVGNCGYESSSEDLFGDCSASSCPVVLNKRSNQNCNTKCVAYSRDTGYCNGGGGCGTATCGCTSVGTDGGGTNWQLYICAGLNNCVLGSSPATCDSVMSVQVCDDCPWTNCKCE